MMDRASSIFARFEPTHSRVLTSEVIGHVLPRVSVGGGSVFSKQEIAQLPSPRASLPSILNAQTTSPNSPLAAHPATVAPQQTPLDYLMEASLSRRMDGVTVYTSKSANTKATSFGSSASSIPPRGPPLIKMTRPAASDAPKPKRRRIRIKTPRRREQCRTNQARYRKKQMEYAKTLEVTVEHLRREVPNLEMQHRRLVSNAKFSLRYAVEEYFHLFRKGFREAWLQTSEAEQQLVFLRSSMAEDVILGEQKGMEALVEQWKRYSSYFDDLQFQLEHTTKVSENFISATASLHVTISESTLQFVFPHLLADDENRRHTAQENKTTTLRSKLLGQRLFLPCRLCFEWDEATKRVIRVEHTLDMAASLLQVLGSIEDAVFVLDRSKQL